MLFEPQTASAAASFEVLESPLYIRASTAVRSMATSCEGGDVADVFILSDGSTAIVLGDCSGHGAQATPNALLLRAATRSLLYRNSDLVCTATTINRLFHRQVPSGSMQWPFATLFLGIFEPRRHAMRYVSCGHDAALLFRGKRRHVDLPANSPLIGLTDSGAFVEETVHLNRNDVLVLATDGVTEAHPLNNYRAFFGSVGVRSAFLSIRNAPARTTDRTDASRLIADAQKFADGDLADDAAALIAYFT